MTNDVGVLSCADMKTGERVWQTRLDGVFFRVPGRGRRQDLFRQPDRGFDRGQGGAGAGSPVGQRSGGAAGRVARCLERSDFSAERRAAVRDREGHGSIGFRCSGGRKRLPLIVSDSHVLPADQPPPRLRRSAEALCAKAGSKRGRHRQRCETVSLPHTRAAHVDYVDLPRPVVRIETREQDSASLVRFQDGASVDAQFARRVGRPREIAAVRAHEPSARAQHGVVVVASRSLWPLTNHGPSGDSAMSPPGCGKASGEPSVSTTRRFEATS